MQLIRWRDKNRLSARDASRLFGISPGNVSAIELGRAFVSASVAIRIQNITAAVGPDAVTPDDHLEAWIKAHPQESIAQRAASRAAVRVFRNAAKE